MRPGLRTRSNRRADAAQCAEPTGSEKLAAQDAWKIGCFQNWGQQPHQPPASGFIPPILPRPGIVSVCIAGCATYEQPACQLCKKVECTRHQADLNWIFKYNGGGPQPARIKNWGIRPDFLGAIGCLFRSTHPTSRTPIASLAPLRPGPCRARCGQAVARVGTHAAMGAV